jgi:nitrite reductase (NO-forming)
MISGMTRTAGLPPGLWRRLGQTILAMLCLALVALAVPGTARAQSHDHGGTATEAATTQPATTETAATEATSAGASPGVSSPAPLVFTLRTGIAQGRMVYIGVGGTINGQINPTLTVYEGELVQVNLINGEGAEHDMFVDQYNARSSLVVEKNASSTFSFLANKPGEFAYFCTIAGHRAAGMEGLIQVIAGSREEADDQVADIVRDPGDVPAPIGQRQPEVVKVELETVELKGRLDNVVMHSVDFHAATGPGGGAHSTQTEPGAENTVTFKALKPGVYVYHCATPSVAHHITNGMYGMIVVEPEGGLPQVDREFYVMQGELYTVEPFGTQGEMEMDYDKLISENPEYFVFNGAVESLTKRHPLYANAGETVRIYFGVGGPNFTSSFHVIGEIFDTAYSFGSVTSPPLTNVQTITVPPGGSTVVDFKLDRAGTFVLVDHALSRAERGLAGYLIVDGPENDEIMHSGTADQAPAPAQ